VVNAPQHLVQGHRFETLSYSLQYAQERLQNRMGTICAITNIVWWRQGAATTASSRNLRVAALVPALSVCFCCIWFY